MQRPACYQPLGIAPNGDGHRPGGTVCARQSSEGPREADGKAVGAAPGEDQDTERQTGGMDKASFHNRNSPWLAKWGWTTGLLLPETADL